MENLNLVLFIAIAIPLTMMLFIFRGRSRTVLLFLLIGMAVCLFCGELNAMLLGLLRTDAHFFTVNISPLTEELCKAIPIVIFGFLYKPSRQTMLESAISVGVGFSLLENAFALAANSGSVSLPLALMRGFGAGMCHGVCTLAVGFGMTFIHKRRKLFYTGTAALLSAAALYHAIYNDLVQSGYAMVGFLLPVLTFVPAWIMLTRKQILGRQ